MSEEKEHLSLIRSSPLFDADWYLARHADVARQNLDPAIHYLRFGGRELRDPGPNFSSRLYLDNNIDVRHSGMDPFLHYLKFGMSECRVFGGEHEFLANFARLDDDDRAAIKNHIDSLIYCPTFSIVVPVYNASARYLSEMIDSVQAQSYPHWELCAIDDHSSDTAILGHLEDRAKSDRRLKIGRRDRNGGISACTNTALQLATGEFACFLDHDDILSEQALYEIAVEISRAPNVDIVYSDSDLIDENGTRSAPYFKTDWNYDLMLGHNLISHFGVFRRELVTAVGGLRSEFDGSQDYDLALRVVERTTPDRIRHVPAILYHWRQTGDAANFSQSNLDRCMDAARGAVAAHLERTGVNAKVEIARNRHFSRVVYPLPARLSVVTVAIRARGSADALSRAVADLFWHQTYDAVEVIVLLDPDASADIDTLLGRLERRDQVKSVRLKADQNWVNAAVERASGEIVVVLDDRLEGQAGWLVELVAQAARPGIGLVAGIVVDGDDLIVDAGTILGAAPWAYRVPRTTDASCSILSLTRAVSAIPLRCAAFRKQAFLSAGGLPPNLSLGAAEIELSRASRAAGLWTVVTPFARFRASEPLPDEGRAAAALAAAGVPDPFYNPNLSLSRGLFALGSPDGRRRPWADMKRRLIVRRGQDARAAAMLDGVPPSARLIEIGPSYNPVAPRSAGWNTRTVDHATREELVEKYGGLSDIWVDRIEEVDFVWTKGTITDAIPVRHHGEFDVLVASHVIEHTPDFVAFLRSAAELLAADGRVILAVPDKRYCFDYFRPLTSTGDVLDAHEGARARHTRGTIFDHCAQAVTNDREGAWAQDAVGRLELTDSLDEAVRRYREAGGSNTAYIDSHAWQFTPASFALILMDLAALELTDWKIARITESAGCEFLVILERGGIAASRSLAPAERDAQRLGLMKQTLRDLAAQVRFFEQGDTTCSDMSTSPPFIWITGYALDASHRPE